MLTNYFKITWRNLIKNKVSTLINCIGLAIGISTCMVILLFVDYETSFDAHHQKAAQTYRVVQHTQLPEQILYWNTTAYPLADALRNDLPEIDLVTQTSGPVPQTFSFENEQGSRTLFEEPYVLFTDQFYHKVFDISWLAGNPDEALTIENGIVITEALANTYFKNQEGEDFDQLLGKTLLLNNKDPLVITGIIKNVPGNSNQKYNMLVSYSFFKKKNPFQSQNWSGNHQGTTFISLKENASTLGLTSKINSWKGKYLKPENNKRISYELQPLTQIHNESLYGPSPGGYIMPSKIMTIASLIAWFILAIAIVNFINLITAQSTSRAKEVGIRKVLGSKSSHLIRQFIFENTILIVSTTAVAFIIVSALIHQLNSNLEIINLQLSLQWGHIWTFLFIGLCTILLGAIYPAVILTAFKPIEVLKNHLTIKSGGGLSLRKSLIVFQFIIVQVFVIGTIIISEQMDYFQNKEIGFTKDAVIITDAPEFSKINTYKETLSQEAYIQDIAFGSGPPMAIDGLQLGTNYRLPNDPVERRYEAEIKVIDPNYLNFYKLELLAGANISENKEGFDEFIVNEKLIETYGWSPQEAIGKRIAINEGEATIIGVVRNFHNNSLQYDITPCILLNWIYFNNKAFIQTSTLNSTSLSGIEAIWKSTFSKGIYNYNFLDSAIAKEYTIEKLIANGFNLFSILAISIGCLGLLGLMYFITARRTREIGIRKVFGAGYIQNITFLSKGFIQLVLVAFLIASPLVYYFMNIWLEGFTYHIDLSIWMFIVGGLLTVGIAVLTSSFQSIKAAMIDPVKSLKTE